jgi:hypothetical protein
MIFEIFLIWLLFYLVVFFFFTHDHVLKQHFRASLISLISINSLNALIFWYKKYFSWTLKQKWFVIRLI